jgi:hypothetical protein
MDHAAIASLGQQEGLSIALAAFWLEPGRSPGTQDSHGPWGVRQC